MEKILILVMSSEIPLIQKRRETVLNTYYNFICKYDNIDLIFYSDGEDLSKHTIKVNADYEYHYRDNEIKQVNIFNVIKEKYYEKYDWFFFVDTDTFINVPLLNNIIDSFDKEYIYGKSLKGCYGDLDYVSGGAGYLLSKNVVFKLFNIKNYNTGYADVTLGLNARDNNIQIKDDNRFDSSNPWRDGINPLIENIKNTLTYHYLDSNNMFKLYDIIK
jgi:hypothetical protein